MALTLTKTASGVMGDKRYWLGTLAFDDSYPTGGESVTAANVEMQSAIDGAVVGTGNVATKRVAFDPSASKFMVFVEDGTTGKEAEAGNTSDQSGITDVQLLVFGE